MLEDDGSIINSRRADTYDYWYRQDIRGSVTNIVDVDDDVVRSYTYDAYGNTDSTSEFVNSFAYTGAVIDEETSLYYMNARYYDPETGRFISQDTYRGDGEAFWHLYVYCDGDPVNNTDRSGNEKRLFKVPLPKKNRKILTGSTMYVSGSMSMYKSNKSLSSGLIYSLYDLRITYRLEFKINVLVLFCSEDYDTGRWIAVAVSTAAGTLAGAAIGAAIGSAGSWVGVTVGSVVGGLVGTVYGALKTHLKKNPDGSSVFSKQVNISKSKYYYTYKTRYA